MMNFSPPNFSRRLRPLTGGWASLLLLAGLAAATPAAGQGTVVRGPSGSVSFGSKVTVLPNGNFAVADPGLNGNRGVVYLYRGTDGKVLSTLTGTNAGDRVGSGGLVALASGNLVVSSPEFGGGGTASNGLGAVTWLDGNATGLTASVSASNSLVGSTAGDRVGDAQVGAASIVALPSGNYLVRSPGWNSGGAVRAGAVTWGSGTSGVKGAVSAGNSLVGQYANDAVGFDYKDTPGITVLANGNYVVVVPSYRVNTATNQGYGAVAWGSGTAGVKGVLGAGNALVGGTSGDRVGEQGITILPNGNYLVISPSCANGRSINAGAVTWGSGTAGVTGTIGAGNSLVGSAAGENVGTFVLPLTNGNYVVADPYWGGSGSAATARLGAVTWGSGTAGVKGAISASNSLVGSTASDQVGFDGTNVSVFPLPNGNYVVFSPKWDNRAASAGADAGALTLGNGSGNTVGTVTACNSIVGSVANQGSTLSFAYNPGANNLLGGLPAENKLVIGVGAPGAPTGAASQSYPTGATVAKLQATGAAIQWYAAATGGSPLASTTPLTNGNTYYATQSVNGCESTSRLAVRVALPQAAQLTSFSATLAGPATVQVSWATTAEKNSQAFEVERSPDGVTFARIGTVAAAGSSSSARSYELPDAQLPARATTLYYRLRQLNQDGTASYSAVHAVALPGAETGLRLYPNPAPGGAATLVGATPGAVVRVTDALGRQVLTAPADAAGTAALTLPAGLPVGVYVVRAGNQTLRLTVD